MEILPKSRNVLKLFQNEGMYWKLFENEEMFATGWAGTVRLSGNYPGTIWKPRLAGQRWQNCSKSINNVQEVVPKWRNVLEIVPKSENVLEIIPK